MAILVQLPNNASTSKYPKTFPHPLNLMHVYKQGDTILDLALKCFKKRKDEIFDILDKYIEKINNGNRRIIINAGDFPPDAAYNVYYDYFFDKMWRDYETIGTYIKINGEQLKKRYKFLHFYESNDPSVPYYYEPQYDIIMNPVIRYYYEPQYDVLDYEKYPRVNGKLKASIRASWGCPRKCIMCPVPLVFNKQYRYFDPIHTAEMIKFLYERRGIRYFTFVDDNLSAHSDFIKLLLTIRKMKLKDAVFHCQEGFDVGTFDTKRARLIKALNFDDVKIAFETLVPRTLELIGKKSINFESVNRTLDAINAVGLKVKSFMLLGLDETEDEIIENLKFFAREGMTLRVNIVRDYGNRNVQEYWEKNRLDDETLKHYKALAYASSFFTEQFGLNLFEADGEEFERKTGLIYDPDKNTLTGKTKYGFQTSRLEKGVKYYFDRDIESNDGKHITFRATVGNNDDSTKGDSGENTGFTAKALKKSREIRKDFLAKFGIEGKVPTSILIHDRKEYRYDTIDLSAQRRGGNYVHHYRINRQKMHEREDYTPGLEHTGFETQGRTNYISGFPQNVGRFIIDLYCPEKAIIYDPFAGHNSRMQLCFKLGHNYIGVDCCKEFMDDNKEIKDMLYERQKSQIIERDNWILLFEKSSESVPEVKDEYADFTITSPPYWDLEYYGPEPEQLGTGKTYEQFLEGIERVIKDNFRILKSGAFCAWFVNDFRKKKKFYPYHSHIYEILTNSGFEGFNIYIVDLGATVNHMFVQDIINHKILPKRHEYCILVKKP